MAPIIIRENVLDPAAPPADVHLPPNASKTNYVLVQLNDGMTPETVTALAEKGATIVKRMVDNTWLVNYPPDDLRALESIDAVDHALVYVDHFVVHDNLKQVSSDSDAEKPLVAVILHEAASSSHQEVLNHIQSFSAPEVIINSPGMLHLQVDPQDLDKIAALDSVQAIEKVTPIDLHNDQTRDIIGINAANTVLLARNNSGLTGADQVVAIADGGIDVTHEALKDKVVARHSYRNEGVEDINGHGTHVAGIVAGRAVQDWKGTEVMGMAPNAKLISLALTGKGVSTLPTVAYNDAIRDDPTKCFISNNSWGQNILKDPDDFLQVLLKNFTKGEQSPYGVGDAEVIDDWALQNPNFLVVRSAGNDGQLDYPNSKIPAQVQSWATGKNVLTVGSTYNDRPTATGGLQVDYTVAKSDTKRNTISPTSSRGLVRNTKRTKPDIVAPGQGILSVRCGSKDKSVQDALDLQLFGAGTFPGGGNATDKLIIMSGTSMASPAVSGCAALLREAFDKWYKPTIPSAPLLKALLINGADDLGVSRNLQGFGQVNLSRTLRSLGSPTSATATVATPVLGSGFAQGVAELKDQAKLVEYKTKVPAKTIASKKLNFIATLVYHDAKGEQINNQMNLVVTYNNTKQETYNSTNTAANNQNVLKLIVPDVSPGQDIIIGVQLKLLAVAGTKVPWGLAWDHFEL